MDFSSYYYYIPMNFYETPEMTLIDNEPNGDSATVLVLALAKIHTRTVTENADGTFTIVTDDGTFTDAEVMELHRVETGESMTKLIVRLLAEELG